MLLAIGCLVLAAGAESRSRMGFIILAAAMPIVAWSLSLLVAHGYRKMHADDSGR